MELAGTPWEHPGAASLPAVGLGGKVGPDEEILHAGFLVRMELFRVALRLEPRFDVETICTRLMSAGWLCKEVLEIIGHFYSEEFRSQLSEAASKLSEQRTVGYLENMRELQAVESIRNATDILGGARDEIRSLSAERDDMRRKITDLEQERTAELAKLNEAQNHYTEELKGYIDTANEIKSTLSRLNSQRTQSPISARIYETRSHELVELMGLLLKQAHNIKTALETCTSECDALLEAWMACDTRQTWTVRAIASYLNENRDRVRLVLNEQCPSSATKSTEQHADDAHEIMQETQLDQQLKDSKASISAIEVAVSSEKALAKEWRRTAIKACFILVLMSRKLRSVKIEITESSNVIERLQAELQGKDEILSASHVEKHKAVGDLLQMLLKPQRDQYDTEVLLLRTILGCPASVRGGDRSIGNAPQHLAGTHSFCKVTGGLGVDELTSQVKELCIQARQHLEWQKIAEVLRAAWVNSRLTCQQTAASRDCPLTLTNANEIAQVLEKSSTLLLSWATIFPAQQSAVADINDSDDGPAKIMDEIAKFVGNNKSALVLMRRHRTATGEGRADADSEVSPVTASAHGVCRHDIRSIKDEETDTTEFILREFDAGPSRTAWLAEDSENYASYVSSAELATMLNDFLQKQRGGGCSEGSYTDPPFKDLRTRKQLHAFLKRLDIVIEEREDSMLQAVVQFFEPRGITGPGDWESTTKEYACEGGLDMEAFSFYLENSRGVPAVTEDKVVKHRSKCDEPGPFETLLKYAMTIPMLKEHLVQILARFEAVEDSNKHVSDIAGLAARVDHLQGQVVIDRTSVSNRAAAQAQEKEVHMPVDLELLRSLETMNSKYAEDFALDPTQPYTLSQKVAFNKLNRNMSPQEAVQAVIHNVEYATEYKLYTIFLNSYPELYYNTMPHVLGKAAGSASPWLWPALEFPSTATCHYTWICSAEKGWKQVRITAIAPRGRGYSVKYVAKDAIVECSQALTRIVGPHNVGLFHKLLKAALHDSERYPHIQLQRGVKSAKHLPKCVKNAPRGG